MIEARTPRDQALQGLLRSHPRVSLVEEWVESGELEFTLAEWHRRVSTGPPKPEVPGGVLELIDNNPLVCADECVLPSPGCCLALIALGPLVRAGLLVEPALLRSNTEPDLEELDHWLRDLGWEGGVIAEDVPGSPENLALHALAVIHTPDSLEEVDALYEECYGRSTFVQMAQGELPPDLGLAAWVQLSSQPDAGTSLLSIRVVCSREGKCGAAHIVQALNTMCGLEETLGLSPP